MKACVDSGTTRQLSIENNELRARLAESEELVRAIRCGEVDAFFVADDRESRVLTLGSPESAHRVLVEAMNEGAAILMDKGAVMYCNGRLSTMLKAPLETVMGASLFRFIAPDDQARFTELLARGKTESCFADLMFRCLDGSAQPVQVSLSPMRIDRHHGICVVATDLTARNLVREELRNLSLMDELTGLLNRRGFLALAQPQLTLARRLNTEVLLIFADLDGFKAINDTLGHPAGDQALTDVAAIFRETYREADIIARLGGDEFAVLAVIACEADMETLAVRLKTNLAARNAGNHRPFQLAMSVGMVRCNHVEAFPIGDLLALADAAMYKQKRGKHRTTMSDALINTA